MTTRMDYIGCSACGACGAWVLRGEEGAWIWVCTCGAWVPAEGGSAVERACTAACAAQTE